MILFKNILMQLFCILLIFVILLLLEIEGKTIVKRGIMDNINSGLKMAGQMLGINTASDVANLVAKAFSTDNSIIKKQDTEASSSQYTDSRGASQYSKDDTSFNPALMLSSMLKLMGFDNAKLGAIALNAIIMIAQMIGKALTSPRIPPTPPPATNGLYENFAEYPTENIQPNIGEKYYQQDQNTQQEQHTENEDQQPRTARNESPIEMLLEKPSLEFSKLLTKVRDKNLTEYLTENVNQLEQNKGDYDCVKILICKLTPFVWGMQDAVRDRIDNSNEDSQDENGDPGNRINEIFKYLPNRNEFLKFGNSCEKKYLNCNYTE